MNWALWAGIMITLFGCIISYTSYVSVQVAIKQQKSFSVNLLPHIITFALGTFLIVWSLS